MGSRDTVVGDQSTADNTPEDVAALYSWANLQGAKYRDYSASRREDRAQARYRAAKDLLERELRAQAEAEASAEEAERAALAAEATARSQIGNASDAWRSAMLRSAETAAQRAAGDRVEAARRAEAAAHANLIALREQREITEAHVSARMQALIYTESELWRRERAGPQPGEQMGDGDAGSVPDIGEVSIESSGGLQPEEHASEHDLSEASDLRLDLSREKILFDAESRMMGGWPSENVASEDLQVPRSEDRGIEAEVDRSSPAWLYASQTPPRPSIPQANSQSDVGDDHVAEMLQGLQSREQVAARWLALKGVVQNAGKEFAATQATRSVAAQTPVLAVFSLAGGVGKTSLVATLGRVLSRQGEKVMLIDTTAHGLLPFYFGASGLRPGVVGSLPHGENIGEPISLATYKAAGQGDDERKQQMLAEEILRNGQGNHRLLLDLGSGLSWMVGQMANLHPIVLVPVAPDMNSVISLQAVERVFRNVLDAEGRPLLPYYMLNQFDVALPLHRDVREVFRRQLGDRLLRIAIRHSPAVSEALAEGMTVVDYAPDAPVSQDYLDVALWLRDVSPPATDGFSFVGWDGR